MTLEEEIRELEYKLKKIKKSYNNLHRHTLRLEKEIMEYEMMKILCKEKK